jgi:predicted secreted Zn-dependent protease
MFKKVVALALLWSVSAFPFPAHAEPDVPADELSAIPDVYISYYDVSGDSESAIRKSMDHSPDRPRDGARAVDALTTWNFSWRTWSDGRGGCDPSLVEVLFTANVELPRLVGSVPPATARDWNRYIANLRTHEAGHVTYARSRIADVTAAAKSSRCVHINAAVQRVLNEIKVHDRLYDRETSHGIKQGAVFP